MTKDTPLTVTIELWNAVMGGTPQDNMMSFPQNPVEYVSWDDCQEFIAQLNALTGRTFRLPSDSEWEYAACGGRLTLAYTYAGSNDINEVAWYRGNIPALDPNVPYSYVTRTQPVATKLPNELGLYDMSGNVMEFCEDDYAGYSSEPQADPLGISGFPVPDKVVRGGYYISFEESCTVTMRQCWGGRPTTHGVEVWGGGFRLAL